MTHWEDLHVSDGYVSIDGLRFAINSRDTIGATSKLVVHFWFSDRAEPTHAVKRHHESVLFDALKVYRDDQN